MADEMIAQNTELVNMINEQGVGELLKPLIREIYLFDSYVAGTTHLEDPAVLQNIKIGDKLALRREDNKFDQKAILLLTDESKKLGYVPERDNVVFSRLLDAGKVLTAQIYDIERHENYTQIQIKIFLVDF